MAKKAAAETPEYGDSEMKGRAVSFGVFGRVYWGEIVGQAGAMYFVRMVWPEMTDEDAAKEYHVMIYDHFLQQVLMPEGMPRPF